MMALLVQICLALALALPVIAQFPPTPQGITMKQVTTYPGVSISYKQTSICETKAKAWAGYVHMPISYLQDIETSEPYNISMFFWYFQAREHSATAPLAIYLAGGPGDSSLTDATSAGGPCYINSDSNSTYENVFSMNQFVNVLYIDQPNQAGYSYDVLLKSVQNLATGSIEAFEEFNGDVPQESMTILHGIFPSQNPKHTANTTTVAAITLWKFVQIWYSEFPEYITSDKRVSIWGNSYGGAWITATGAYIQKQNSKIQKGDVTGNVIDLYAIGFTNGWVDQLYQGEWYPHVAYDNVYDFQVIPKAAYEKAVREWSKPGGVRDAILKCRELGEIYDPTDFAVNATVNEVCLEAFFLLLNEVFYGPYQNESMVGNRSLEDMAHRAPDPYPPSYATGFFNQEWVQKDLGVPLNFTASWSSEPGADFLGSGDPVRKSGIKDLEFLLDSGVKVTMINGDRDYRCNWVGDEKLSLAANWSQAQNFRSAGYAYIRTNGSYNGGLVREHGNFSFSRVFQAGHDAYAYQPETIFQIFNRSLSNTDIATGKISTAGASNNYSSTGPSSCEGIKLELPLPPPPVSCYQLNVGSTCTVDQLAALKNGTAEIQDFTVVKPVGGGGPIPQPL